MKFRRNGKKFLNSSELRYLKSRNVAYSENHETKNHVDYLPKISLKQFTKVVPGTLTAAIQSQTHSKNCRLCQNRSTCASGQSRKRNCPGSFDWEKTTCFWVCWRALYRDHLLSEWEDKLIQRWALRGNEKTFWNHMRKCRLKKSW